VSAVPEPIETGAGKQALRLWLRLLACTNQVEQQVRQRLRGEFDITLPQFDVLAELDAADGPQTMSALSRRLMVSNGNVTGVIDRLVRAGLVGRSVSPTDRRVQYIALTTVGRQRFATMAAAHESWVASLFAGVGPEQQAQLLDLLGTAKRVVQAQLDAPEAVRRS